MERLSNIPFECPKMKDKDFNIVLAEFATNLSVKQRLH